MILFHRCYELLLAWIVGEGIIPSIAVEEHDMVTQFGSIFLEREKKDKVPIFFYHPIYPYSHC
jgi:hypothetical protein